jgi:hypothetical protein
VYDEQCPLPKTRRWRMLKITIHATILREGSRNKLSSSSKAVKKETFLL